MDIKKNKGNGKYFDEVEIGKAVEDNDGNVYLKIGIYTLLSNDDVNAIDLETNLLCYIEPKEIVYPYKKAFISLEN